MGEVLNLLNAISRTELAPYATVWGWPGRQAHRSARSLLVLAVLWKLRTTYAKRGRSSALGAWQSG